MRTAFKSQTCARAAQALFILLLFSAAASARSYHIARFNSNVHVDVDGSARVTEQITFAFSGQYQGVYRSIPVDYPGPNGTNYSLFIKVTSVTDENATPLKYEKHTSGHYLRLKIFVP